MYATINNKRESALPIYNLNNMTLESVDVDKYLLAFELSKIWNGKRTLQILLEKRTMICMSYRLFRNCEPSQRGQVNLPGQALIWMFCFYMLSI